MRRTASDVGLRPLSRPAWQTAQPPTTKEDGTINTNSTFTCCTCGAALQVVPADRAVADQSGGTPATVADPDGRVRPLADGAPLPSQQLARLRQARMEAPHRG